MKYPEVGDTVMVLMEDGIERGIVEEWGSEWIELKQIDDESTICIKEKYIVGFKITSKTPRIKKRPVIITGVTAEQLDAPVEDTSSHSHALRMASKHLGRIENERKKVKQHLKRSDTLREYPNNYKPIFSGSKK